MSPYSRAQRSECPGQLRASSRALPRKKFPFGPGGEGSLGDITACAISKVYPFALCERTVPNLTQCWYWSIICRSISVASWPALYFQASLRNRIAKSARGDLDDPQRNESRGYREISESCNLRGDCSRFRAVTSRSAAERQRHSSQRIARPFPARRQRLR